MIYLIDSSANFSCTLNIKTYLFSTSFYLINFLYLPTRYVHLYLFRIGRRGKVFKSGKVVYANVDALSLQLLLWQVLPVTLVIVFAFATVLTFTIKIDLIIIAALSFLPLKCCSPCCYLSQCVCLAKDSLRK